MTTTTTHDYSDTSPLYMGLDCSTQQLKAILITSELRVVSEARVDFDAELGSKYGVKNGTHHNPEDHSVYAPVAMWLDAIDLVLEKLVVASNTQQQQFLHRVAGISGAGIQHSAVFWGASCDERLGRLDAALPLSVQISYSDEKDQERGGGGGGGALSWPFSPNWQDGSTQSQCDEFDGLFASPERLAEVTGSKAHHRFTGPQILRFVENHPDEYAATKRISLVSSFLASVFLGKVAPMDISDVCGMNLWDMAASEWSKPLLSLTSRSRPDELKVKLGAVVDGNASLGTVSNYFVKKYNFSPSCRILPFTGDNPATILSLPLRENDAIVSLGTSTTFLTVTPKLVTHPSYHMFTAPTATPFKGEAKREYMFMLCYKNGGLAREKVRDACLSASSALTTTEKWSKFNDLVLSTAPLGHDAVDSTSQPKIGLYFPLREIVPNVKPGTRRYTFQPSHSEQTQQVQSSSWPATLDPRIIVESQLLSIRLRSQSVAVSSTPLPSVAADPSSSSSIAPSSTSSSKSGGDADELNAMTKKMLPPQPRRIYLVGGGAENAAIQRLVGQVLGGTEGVWKLNVGGAACALGGAHKALWSFESEGEDFASFLMKRWDLDAFAVKVDPGYDAAVWKTYGDALPAFEAMEAQVLSRDAL